MPVRANDGWNCDLDCEPLCHTVIEIERVKLINRADLTVFVQHHLSVIDLYCGDNSRCAIQQCSLWDVVVDDVRSENSFLGHSGLGTDHEEAGGRPTRCLGGRDHRESESCQATEHADENANVESHRFHGPISFLTSAEQVR